MKKKFVGLIALATSSLLVLGFGVNLYLAPAKDETTASKSSYWDSWVSSHSSDITNGGEDLYDALNEKVADGFIDLSYANLWTAYQTTDLVPGSTNLIWDMYGGFQFRYGTDQAGSYSEEGDVYNREHSVPKSWFSEAQPAHDDLVHLVPTDGYVNNKRGNYAFGEVSSASYTYKLQARSYNGVQYQEEGYSKLGTPKSINGVSCPASPVFEPADQFKGDFARIYFYFAVRYGNNSSCKATKGDGGAIFTSSYTDDNPYLTDYGKALLLKWHNQDPVSDKEITRNNGIESIQGNRNPFVDYPEWVDKVFNHSSSGTDPVVHSVTVSPSTLSLNLADKTTGNLTATVSVSNGAAQTVNWTSSNTGVATVNSSGKVTAVSTGTATITATSTVNNDKKGTCSVTVTESGGSGSSSEYELYSGSLTEGDYIIVYDNKAMANTVSSNRLSYSSVTITNNTISSPNSSIIWHIAPSSTYWTIYNANVAKYAAGNGTKNQAALLTDASDNGSLWTVSGTSTYEFVNKKNNAASVNANLRENGTYGFACYSTQTGGALSLYKQSSSSPDPTPTSITATVSKTFYVGETISKSDISVKDNLNNTITDYTFSNYQFTYNDGLSGGSIQNKEFTITYNSMNATLSVPVARKAYATVADYTVNYLSTDFSSLASSYTTNQSITVNGMPFSVNGYYYSSGQKLSLSQSKTSAPGSVINTVAYSSGITNVEVTGASPNIQLSTNGSTWVDLSSATPSTVNYYYFKIFYKNTTQTNYVNISQISVTLKGSETAKNVSNYIMFEDSENQCTTKFTTASGYFNNLSSSEKSAFMTSSDYVISNARERFEAWAANRGKTITYTNGTYTITNASHRMASFNNENNTGLIVLLIGIMMCCSTFAVAFYMFKKHSNV